MVVSLRSGLALLCLGIALSGRAQTALLPDQPPPNGIPSGNAAGNDGIGVSSATLTDIADLAPGAQAPQTEPVAARSKPGSTFPVDAQGNPIPLERRQPQRILGLLPNFRSVSRGAKPPAPGWKYNFKVATSQATDYSSFIFLGLTSLTAEAMNMHPALGKGVPGFYAYTWRGFLDKTDNTYMAAWLLPSLLHQDTRFYALGPGHTVPMRALYVISRQAVARTYRGHDTPNIAGLGGKVITQEVSRYYYPSSATTFSVLATKFAYSVMRDVAFSSVREFYPDIAAHYVRRHRAKIAQRAKRDTSPGL